MKQIQHIVALNFIPVNRFLIDRTAALRLVEYPEGRVIGLELGEGGPRPLLVS